MKFVVLALLGASVASAANPLGTVISLLDSLTAKITAEGEAEAAAYKEFVEWCDGAARDNKFAIITATTKKEKLQAAIGKATGDIESSFSKIDELAGSIASDGADLTAATQIRDKEAADFAANEAELVDVVDTLGRATAIIEREMQKNPAAFAQVDTSSLNSLVHSLTVVADAAAFSTVDKQKLLGLVQSQGSAGTDEDDAFGPPAAASYKSHSTSILDVLEDLKEKAEEQLSDLRKAESNSKHNYNMLKQSLDDQTKADNKEMLEEKAAKAASEEAKATAEGDLAGTVKDLADAESALAVASSNCMSTAADHAATVAGRAEELKVIAQARAILTDTSSGAVDQTYSFAQLNRDASVSTLHTRADLASAEVVTMVKHLAQEFHSKALSQLASRIHAVLHYGASAGEDPFTKVRALISDMIMKLEAQASSEATEKAYCDEQIAKTEEKKGELQYDISKLTAKIDQASAKSSSLKESVAESQSELAELAKTTAEMNKIRQESHAAYVGAKADLEEGLDGVRKALGMLRDYYGAASASAAMLQSTDDQPAVPELHEKAAGAGTSIIGILEVVESDFAKNLAEEETQEDDAEAQYQKTTQANKITRTLKEQDVKYETQEFKSLDKSISEMTADRESTDSELSAVLEYYAKIKERCIAKPETYEERSRRRTAEIAGLKEALTILEDETALVQKNKKGGLRGGFLGMPRA